MVAGCSGIFLAKKTYQHRLILAIGKPENVPHLWTRHPTAIIFRARGVDKS
jgi:hypothetical protein